MLKFIGIGILALGTAGCATMASQVAPAYVSPLAYSSYTCAQLSDEHERVAAYSTHAYARQRSAASSDIVSTVDGLLLFGPALLARQGNSSTESDLAQSEGQLAAIEAAAASKKCGGIQFAPKLTAPG